MTDLAAPQARVARGERALYAAVLIALGIGWGLTQPMSKIAVGGGYRHFGLVFWQLAIGAVLLGALTLARGKGLPLQPPHLRLYAILALIGTVVPNSASYAAAVHLPSGILSLVLSLVPMFAFPVALALGNDSFRWSRLAGLSLGLGGVALIALPQSSLPDPRMAAYLPLALVAPFLYALEGNYVARWGTAGLDPVQVLAGASLAGAAVALPLALFSGHWIDPRPPWGAPDAAVVILSAIHAAVYTGYVWLVGRAGAVFAAQVSYLVTGCGLLWAMALLSERYSLWIWAALALMFAGLFLVQPRPRTPLAATVPLQDDAAS